FCFLAEVSPFITILLLLQLVQMSFGAIHTPNISKNKNLSISQLLTLPEDLTRELGRTLTLSLKEIKRWDFHKGPYHPGSYTEELSGHQTLYEMKRQFPFPHADVVLGFTGQTLVNSNSSDVGGLTVTTKTQPSGQVFDLGKPYVIVTPDSFLAEFREGEVIAHEVSHRLKAEHTEDATQRYLMNARGYKKGTKLDPENIKRIATYLNAHAPVR
ncbi:hypothetical protein HZB01_02910, partial [Candidatus Woesearchaeota archaeon]|nr:hypothetical protein [Candidatus Woesearchaeota archaeon]